MKLGEAFKVGRFDGKKIPSKSLKSVILEVHCFFGFKSFWKIFQKRHRWRFWGLGDVGDVGVGPLAF